MPRKRQFRRLRRLRLVGTAAGFAVLLGGAGVFLAADDALHRRPGGVAGIVICALLVATGIGPLIWALRTDRQVATEERERLRAQGLDDGLPMGAFVEQQRVGLEAADFLLVVATLFLGVGLLFAVSGATEPDVGWGVGLAFGSLMGFLPAAALVRLGTGTRLWLTPDGIERHRWPTKSMRWADVARMVPLSRGVPDRWSTADSIELQTSDVDGRRRRWGGSRFTVRVMPLEVSMADLVPLIEERLPAPLLDDPRR